MIKLKNNYLVRPVPTTSVEKGNTGHQLLLQSLVNLNDILEPDDTGNFPCEKVKEYIKNTYGIDVALHLTDSVYVPIPLGSSQGKLDNIKFPIMTSALNLAGESLEISEEDYKNFLALDNLKESAESVNGNHSISDSIIQKILSTLFPDYSSDLKYMVNEESNTIYVYHHYTKETTPASIQKESLYPTTAKISLIFTRIQLKPEMFHGKEQVTKKELINYIGKDYPEYSMERTEIHYDKKKNIIIPVLKSGKRGCGPEYHLEDNADYRMEQTPLMSIYVKKNTLGSNGCSDGEVHINLPKIPFYILKQIVYFFWDVYIFYRAEAIVQIFYHLKESAYHIYIPHQAVNQSSVEFARNPELEQSKESILAMEIHSHGMHQAFWSSTDNQEELKHGFYAVIGDLSNFCYDRNHIRIRGATGGYHVEVRADKIFDFPKNVEEFNKMLTNIKKI